MSAPGGEAHTPIGAEIASAQGALVAIRSNGNGPDAAVLRETSVPRGSGPRPTQSTSIATPSPRDGKRRSDIAWLALEERVAAQVSGLQQKQSSDQYDADRVLRASVTRLESRVRTLEGHSVKYNRQAAELAGLAQALTEEQRALLIRLDRFEEHFRCTRQNEPHISSEEWLRRLGRVEREQRAAALNLRLIVSVTEEAQQRQHQRFRSFEDLVESRLRPVEARLQLRAPDRLGDGRAPSGSPRRRARNGGDAGGAPRAEPLAMGLHANASFDAGQFRRCEEARLGRDDAGAGPSASGGPFASTSRPDAPPLDGAHFESMDQLTRRLEAMVPHRESAASGSMGDNLLQTDKTIGVAQELRTQLHSLCCNLAPRTDAVEARVRALSDAMEELQAQQNLRVDAGELHAHIPPELKKLAEGVLVTNIKDVAHKIETHDAKIAEIRSRLELFATHEQVSLACRDLRSSQSGLIEELWTRLEAVSSTHGDCASSIAKSVSVHADAIDQLRQKVDTLASQADARGGQACVEAVEDLRRRLNDVAATGHSEALVTRVGSNAAALEELRERLDEVVRASKSDGVSIRVSANAQAIAELRAHVQHLHQPLDELRGQLQGFQQPLEQRLAALREPQTRQAEALDKLRIRCDELSSAGRAQSEELVDLRNHVLATHGGASEIEGEGAGGAGCDFALLAGQDVSLELKEIRGRCVALQDMVDKDVLAPVWQVQHILPQAMQKLEWMQSEYVERMAKFEEQSVRLSLALARLGTHEQKVQSCMDRLERMPTLNQTRAMWQEEISRRFEEANVEGLNKAYNLQAQGLEELGERLQHMSDQLAYGGVRSRGDPRAEDGGRRSFAGTPAKGS